MKNRKELFSKMAYACGDIYGGGAFIIVGLLLLVYLTNVEGFSGTLAGLIVFIGLFSKVAQKKGKTAPAYVSAGVWIAASVAIVFMTPATPDMMVISICSLIGIEGAGCNLFSWSALPDKADVDELIT